MVKKPIFVSPEEKETTNDKKAGDGPAPTRLYRDPAERTPPDLPSPAADATRIIAPQPAAPAPDMPETTKPAAAARKVAPEPAPTRVLAVEPAQADPGLAPAKPAVADEDAEPVVGWLVIVDGPGRGRDIPFTAGMNAIGRGSDNDVVLDFGDDEIATEAHAFIVYDDEGRTFHATHAGQKSVVRLNDQPLLEAKQVRSGDQLRLGETTLRLVTLCGPDFHWSGD